MRVQTGLALTLALTLASWGVATLARADGEILSVDGRASSIKYSCVHKLHKFDGKSSSVQGKARLLPDGQAQVMIRVPVESFDSGNANRDAHMKETVEAARFPNVELKAIVDKVNEIAAAPVDRKVKAAITFHGVTQELEIAVRLHREGEKIVAHASFQLSQDAFKIDRPSLMFVKVDDPIQIDADLRFAK
jgi:polyisoprenoid-binding protein YceI